VATIDDLKNKQWFYPFRMPDGSVLSTYVADDITAIHSTRWQMLEAVVKREFGPKLATASVIDIACHQGFFSAQMAQLGCGPINAVDARPEHVADTKMIASVLGLSNVSAKVGDVFDLGTSYQPHDLVLMFGLLYHLENPIGALRVARKLTKKLCVIETQVVPHMSGMVDWGSYRFVRPLQGVFGIIDEMDETHAPEASVTGICLAPSVEGLLWILQSVGFARAEVLPVPDNGYEQLKHGKRVMVAAYV
jgi:tRNA (mo5U34)-methyltransferase